MRAVVTTSPGSIEIIDVDRPEPGAGQVRVRVEVASINPVDGGVVAGVFSELGWIDQPDHIGLGWDASGVVDAVGPGVDTVRPGDRVAAFSNGVDKPLGALAGFVVVPTDAVAPLPDALSTQDAATFPLNGLTAIQALDLLGEPAGELLITGAAGAVGGFAATLAADRGWQVLGLARASDREFVESAGAALVTALPDAPVDAVLDTAVLATTALAAVRDGGRYVGVLPAAVPESVRGIDTAAITVQDNGIHLAQVIELAASGRLAARHAAEFSLDDAPAAFAALGESGLRGRVTVRP
ncbi:NADP-dependent oxidoreductase [Calidifontibacter sp. DB0510]|uniref:NADP-dependent oxidoreductase n=1 Tax=Metallococcus carri TaxID=1656884 RepID=A0A967B1T4_9MICO|nr:NADP-dependent oxidoreductase [Metallococcus carri]NHN57246.1 NADP-dependent oxidoreductase [Metallococcus carri]NOP37951.1 NADP-dependent oxidoreductase [Calidifontibacter sp. DB2511S]